MPVSVPGTPVVATPQPVNARGGAEYPSSTGGIYEAKSAELAGAATLIDDAGASGGQAVRNNGAEGSTLTFNKVDGGMGGTAPCVISYANGDSEPISICVRVNGTVAGTVSLPPTGGWSGPSMYQTVTCHLGLKGGMTNTIQFATNGQDWVCNKITVHPLLPTSFTMALQAGVLCVMTNYWPLVLMLMVFGITVYLIRNRRQYYRDA